MTFLPNGQWKLEKWDSKQRAQANEWAEGGMRENLKDLPPAQGKLRDQMMQDLHTDMKGIGHRTNSKTGKKEFLLHRVHHQDDKLHSSELTSWTHHKDFTDYWGGNTDPKDRNKMRVTSAWVPEDKIHSYLPTVTRVEGGKDFGYEDYKDEGEVLVHPHDLNVHEVSTPNLKSTYGQHRP